MKIEFLRRFAPVTVALVSILVLPATAFAYVGPGAGLSIVGSLLAFLAAIVIGLFGFIWFPVRRFLRKRRLAAERNAKEKDNVSGRPVDDPDGEAVKQGESDA